MRSRDRLVCGLRCKEMQRRVCEEQFGGKLSLDRVLQLCAAFQSSRDTEQQLSGGTNLRLSLVRLGSDAAIMCKPPRD